ncbi:MULTISPECIES: hypothetical protein [Sphingobium]|jgi:hypothetical protein|uniref:hypothetical protein n=1 Tax=Sphingobium TaxID=165695 RepID=UPI0011AE75AC|nr:MULTISPECIES: hypothetical protein [Sphingobium]KAA9016236.1 hypothetical protein F4U94_11340 [Sphingobium limneticum]MBU0933595.1 hypothetical protein [Alphaproteobacteria bacterium]
MTLADQIEDIVGRRTDMTEAMLAEALFGSAGYQQRVNSTCRRMIKEGRLKRSGRGGATDPFTYSLAL